MALSTRNPAEAFGAVTISRAHLQEFIDLVNYIGDTMISELTASGAGRMEVSGANMSLTATQNTDKAGRPFVDKIEVRNNETNTVSAALYSTKSEYLNSLEVKPEPEQMRDTLDLSDFTTMLGVLVNGHSDYIRAEQIAKKIEEFSQRGTQPAQVVKQTNG